MNGNRWVGTRSGLPGLTSETPQGSVAKAFSFDAEDQITQATVNGLTATYVFDGLGQRVAKTAPQSGGGTVTTTYVYTADGTLAAEYSSDLLPSECGVQTCFVTVDQVGSTRLVTDSAGNVTRRYDYLPFGSELNTGVGGRTAAMGYAAAGTDTFEVKYAGQVRDAETGLDQMGLRMYSPEQGRFIGVDPDNAGAVAGVPDTWNEYAYVGNNPLNFTDPSGESWWSALGGVVAGIGTFLGTGNPALAFTVGKTVFAVGETAEALTQGRVPGVDLFSPGGGTSPFACGGPLGNCGSIGGVWTEQGLGPNVQDPGRFESDYDGRAALANTADFVAGAGDSASFGFSAWFRRRMAGEDPRNHYSGYYTAGTYAPLVISLARDLYAGAAKALPAIVEGTRSKKRQRGFFRQGTRSRQPSRPARSKTAAFTLRSRFPRNTEEILHVS